jgi:hypothetical protein
MTISSSRTIPMNSSHRIWLKLLKIPVYEEALAALGTASGVPKTLQNRRVSSAAADATVQPSGLYKINARQARHKQCIHSSII